MPTETFAIETAAGFRYATFTVSKPLQLFGEVKAELVAAGWTQVAGLKARYRLEMPYGLPTVTEPDPIPPLTACSDGLQLFRIDTYDESGVRTSRKRFCAVDAYRNSVIEHPDIVWVPLGVTAEGSVENLAREINDHSDFTVTARYQYGGSDYSWVIELEADTAGTAGAPYADGGLSDLMGDTAGYWNYVTYSGGAGWHLSDTYGATTLHLYLTGLPLVFRFRVGSDPAELECDMGYPSPRPSSVTFEMVASRYQFALWDPTYAWANVMASMPWLPAGKGVSTAAVAVAGFQSRDSLRWTGTQAGTAVNGGFLAGTQPSQRMSGLCASWNLGPFSYASGDDLVENAWVMAPRADLSDGTTSRVIGKLWNAFVMRRDATKGEIIARESQRYLCVARNGGWGMPAASLWVRIE